MRLDSVMPKGEEAAYWALPDAKVRSFTATNFREPSHGFLWHYHPEWELTWISGGRGQRYVGCAVDPFGPGDLTLLGGNLPHTWFSDPDDRDEARCSVIQFQPSLWGPEFWKLPEIREFHVLCDSAVRGLKFSGPGVAEVGRRMEELAAHDTHDFQSFVRFIEIIGLLTKLPATSLRASGEKHFLGTNPRLQSLLKWIEERSAEPLTQVQAAAQVGMTSSAFCRWFKSQMGCVFVRYLNELRIARACSLLVNGKSSVTDTAFRSGFNSLSNFNRRFQEITGQTPMAFRRQFNNSSKGAHRPSKPSGTSIP